MKKFKKLRKCQKRNTSYAKISLKIYEVKKDNVVITKYDILCKNSYETFTYLIISEDSGRKIVFKIKYKLPKYPRKTPINYNFVSRKYGFMLIKICLLYENIL